MRSVRRSVARIQCVICTHSLGAHVGAGDKSRREHADVAFEVACDQRGVDKGKLKPTSQIKELGIDDKWIRSYNIQRGVGTYFASAFAVFLRSYVLEKVRDIAPRKAYIIFPDYGAHRRFYRSAPARADSNQ